MKQHRENKMRHGVAMIELVFAIMVMGIALMSAPMLIGTATQSGYVAVQQEAIGMAATHLNNIMGYAWDENSSLQDGLHDTILRTNGHAELREVGGLGRRAGSPAGSPRTFINDGGDRLDAVGVAAIGPDAGETGAAQYDDMDDFTGTTSGLQDIGGSGTVDYMEKTTIEMETEVSYASDNLPGSESYRNANKKLMGYRPFQATGSSSNIKQIIVTLTSTSTAEELNQKKIVLRAFSCNIGTVELEEK